MLRLCRFNTIADVLAETLELAVAEVLRDVRNLSNKTLNDYLKAPAQLCRWMARPRVGRARFNPLADVEHYPAGDPRHPRRSLSRELVLKVIEHARGAAAYKRMTGPDRAAYYLVKLHTGLRNTEAASLTPESFDLAADPPTITVAAAYSKHRRIDVQTILPAVAGRLREWLATKAAGVPVFDVCDKPYLMWKADLIACGIAYRDGCGFADLYSLRHTFATELGRSGASIKTVKQLMRHSDVRLTERYMKSTVFDEIRALGHLPMPPAPCSQAPLSVSPEQRQPSVPRDSMQLAGVEPATFGSVDRRVHSSPGLLVTPEMIRAVLAHLAALNGGLDAARRSV